MRTCTRVSSGSVGAVSVIAAWIVVAFINVETAGPGVRAWLVFISSVAFAVKVAAAVSASGVCVAVVGRGSRAFINVDTFGS